MLLRHTFTLTSDCVVSCEGRPVHFRCMRLIKFAIIRIKCRELYNNREPITRCSTTWKGVLLHEFLQFPVGHHEKIRQLISGFPPLMRSYLGNVMNLILHDIATNRRGSFTVVFNIDFLSDRISATYGEQEVMNRVLIESMEAAQASLRTIPASTSSVEALERLVYLTEAFRDVKCVVCQEEFSDGESVTKMPYSHIFHGQCITQWLKQSYNCPVCRFELEKQEEIV